MAYAPAATNESTNSATANRSNFTKEEVGCRVIRNEKEWKWGKQVSKNCASLISDSREPPCKRINEKISPLTLTRSEKKLLDSMLIFDVCDVIEIHVFNFLSYKKFLQR
jgi:hypothetical protein